MKIAMTNDYRQLYELAKTLHAEERDPLRTAQTLLKRTGEMLDVHHACLMLFKDSPKPEQIFVLGANSSSEIRKREVWEKHLQQGLLGYVYHSQRMVVLKNIAADSRWNAVADNEIFPKTGSALGLAMLENGRVYAVMMLLHTEIDYFNDERIALLDEIANLATPVFANLRDRDILRSGDSRYETVFEHTPVPVLLTDGKGIIEDANFQACEFLGYQRSVLRGIPLQDVNLVPLDELEQLGANEERYFRTETYDIDGKEIPTLVRARRVQINGRGFIEWILQDMSAEMELEQLRRDLSAMVYHDLRGPLGSIHLSIHKLAEILQGHENPLVLRVLQLGLRSIQQLSRLVDSLLDIQRLEDGSSILNSQASEVHLLLTDALQLVMPSAKEAKVTIDLDIVRMPLVYVDTDMITRVLINLMENAIKYTPENGKIVLSATMRAHEVLISIQDTGPGIPPEMRQRIFDKFSRVKYKDAPKGIGLGLAFCRLAVEAHRGRIWVESDGANGSNFLFTLPLENFGEGTEKLEEDTKPSYATTTA